eukprot:4627784-Pleurochrysis_carterae.AAC.1
MRGCKRKTQLPSAVCHGLAGSKVNHAVQQCSECQASLTQQVVSGQWACNTPVTVNQQPQAQVGHAATNRNETRGRRSAYDASNQYH